MTRHDNGSIPAEMWAAVYHGPRDIRMERVAVPHPADGEILVRVLRSGLCGTDVTEWTSGPKMIPLDHEHPNSHYRGPMITGHEIVGEVVAGSRELEPGTLVVCGASVPCWNCDRCHEGRTNICQHLYSLGLNAPGGNAQYVAGPARSFIPFPPDLDLDAAGITQPLAVGIHAARRSHVQPGETVVLVGAGAIGSFILAGLRYLSPDVDVVVADVDDERLARATRLGAKRTINVDGAQGLPNAPDLVIEASGAPGQLKAAVDLVRPGGRILAVGLPEALASIDAHHLVFNEISLDSSVALVIDEDLHPALEVLATTSIAAEVLDSVRPLGAISETLDQLAAGDIPGKVLLDPTDA